MPGAREPGQGPSAKMCKPRNGDLECGNPLPASQPDAEAQAETGVKKNQKEGEEKRDYDDEYCKALAWAIDNGRYPMTVGLYGSSGRCKDSLLEKIRDHLSGPTSGNHESQKLSVKEIFTLIFRMLFYNVEECHKKQQETCYIVIEFSAWQCTGCDQLWAGLVTALCDGIEEAFGLMPISFYRALRKENNDSTTDKSKKWVPKKFSEMKAWFVFYFAFLLLVGALLLKFFPHNDVWEAEDYDGVTDYTLYTTVTILVGSSLLQSGTVLKVIKNSIVTQKGKLLNKLKKTDMSSQLGFMNDVKTEIEIIIQYLQMMEININQKIRVVIEITKLDKCMPDRVVSVLHAINILLSKPHAPFITILAVDPGIIVDCVEKSDQLKGMANNGYLFLNRIVTLPFSIPLMNDQTKRCHLDEIIKDKSISKKEKPSNRNTKNEDQNKCENVPPNKVTTHCNDAKAQKVDKIQDPENNDKGKRKSEIVPLLEVTTHFGDGEDQRENKMQDQGKNDFIQNSLNSLNECLRYITDDVINMRRIVNSIVITNRLMEDEKDETLKAKVSKWVIMAAQWPCSLSWILQLIEDEEQGRKDKVKIQEPEEKNGCAEDKLCDIYDASLEAFHANREDLQHLLELDGDPDVFCEFLKNSKLTRKEAIILKEHTVNLDYTIRRKIELLLRSCNFFRLKKKKSLGMKDLLDMDTDGVCKKLLDYMLKKKDGTTLLGSEEEKKLLLDYMVEKKDGTPSPDSEKEKILKEYPKLPDYVEKIKANNLNGKALLYSDNEEIRKALGMNLGDWVIFRSAFLSLPTPNLFF
ncbi:hypothetical protein GDO81_003306 [Engystomops pustulosus]|uniref:KAP NTPase domain-containing protein n=1 Tax=Engystomops pustulosus TaxID=76066 RepID=A0AAV6ZV37_ENGPU|nr:hypothetical protein GDO81_003306 [Engystomops pustulosus]